MSFITERKTRLTTVCASDTKNLVSLKGEWKDLYDKSGCTNPFVSYEWVENWWKIFGEKRDPFTHKLNIITFRDSADRLRAITPMVLDSVGFGGLGIKKLRMAGVTEGHYLTEMHGSVVDPAYESDFNVTFLDEIQRQRQRVHWVDIDGLVAQTPLSSLLHAQLKSTGWSYKVGSEFFVLPVQSSMYNVLRHASANLRGRLNNSRKKLNGHNVGFEIVNKPQEIKDAINTFVALHTQRASLTRIAQNGDAVRKHSNYLPTKDHRLFIGRICGDLAQEGKVMITQLRVDGDIQASLVLLRAGNTFYRYYSGFNPDWWDYRIMLYLTAETVRAATEMPEVDFINLSTGREDTKTSWRPETYQLEYFRADSTNPRKRLAIMVYELAKKTAKMTR